MHLNSMGRAILAFLPADEQNEILQRMTLNNGNARVSLDQNEMREEMEKIKHLGYAVNKVQYRGGAMAVSVPILNQKGKAIAGINVGMPSNAPPDEEHFNKIVQLLIKTGEAISSEIGYMDYMEE
jgi:DNA-binding IclR family transcriptional regulator